MRPSPLWWNPWISKIYGVQQGITGTWRVEIFFLWHFPIPLQDFWHQRNHKWKQIANDDNTVRGVKAWSIFSQIFTDLQWHDDVIKWKHFPRYWPFVLGNSPVTGEFPAQRPVSRSFDVFFDLRLNKRLSKHSWGWWFETLSCPLWRQCVMNQWT